MEGFITGAISGAFFFAAGGVIGSITKALELQGLAANAVGAGIHALAGGASGALGAVATGGDPARAAPISAAAAGMSYLLGNAAPFLKAVEGEFFKNAVKRAAIGAVVGGGVSSATGGDFATGAQQGAKTSAIAYVANCAMSEIAGKLRKAKEKAKNTLNVNKSSNNKPTGQTGEYLWEYTEVKVTSTLPVDPAKIDWGSFTTDEIYVNLPEGVKEIGREPLWTKTETPFEKTWKNPFNIIIKTRWRVKYRYSNDNTPWYMGG